MKVRFRFSKAGKVRWTSHRDVARMWERAFRRVELPLAYSVGFSPRPKVSFGLALSTGHESRAEYLDVELATEANLDLVTIPARLSAALPTGVDVTAAGIIDDRADSLQHEVTSCSWQIELAGTAPYEADRLAAAALAADALVISRERKGQTTDEDIRPGLLALEVSTADALSLDPLSPGSAVLVAELATHPRAVRPSELLRALGEGLEEGRVVRTHQWIQRDGARREPLPLTATAAPHAEARAS